MTRTAKGHRCIHIEDRTAGRSHAVPDKNILDEWCCRADRRVVVGRPTVDGEVLGFACATAKRQDACKNLENAPLHPKTR